jgi:hypothetical protein
MTIEYEQLPEKEQVAFAQAYHKKSYAKLMQRIKKMKSSPPQPNEGKGVKLISQLIREGKYPYDYPFMIDGKTKEQWDEYHKSRKVKGEQSTQNGRFPEKNGRKKAEKTSFTNEWFIKRIEAGVYNMIPKSLRNPTILLLYLLHHQNWKGKKDKHNTYDYWYCKRHLIVASVSIEQMAADLEMSEKTIRRYLKSLERDEVIIKHKVGLENIYILGQVLGQDELYLYSHGTNRTKLSGLIQDSSDL